MTEIAFSHTQGLDLQASHTHTHRPFVAKVGVRL